MENAKLEGREYVPFRYENGDTRKELLARSRYLLFKSGEKWTLSQSKRAEILFREYPDLKTAYGLSHSLRIIFSKNTIKDAARLSMAYIIKFFGFKTYRRSYKIIVRLSIIDRSRN